MSVIYVRREGSQATEQVNDRHPLPVEIMLPVVVGAKTLTTEWVTVPGMHSGSAYASGDAMGTMFGIPVACAGGEIRTLNVFDLDKESLGFDILLFSEPFTATADDAAMDIADGDRVKFRGSISVVASDYLAFNDNSTASIKNVGFAFTAPRRMLWAQCVTRGAPNYTTAQDLLLQFVVLQD